MVSNEKFNLRLFVILIMVMAVILFPRFDRLDRFGIDQYTTSGKAATKVLADAEKYIAYVLYFRGEVGQEALKSPWAYRPLPTFLASLLPLKPMTAINLVNFIFLSLGLFYLMKTLALIGVAPAAIKLGGAMYVVSFPVFFYGSIGYIDPILVGMLCISQYLILKGRNILFFIFLILGAFVKEPYIIVLPAWLAYQYALPKRKYLPPFLIAGFAFIAFLTTLYLIRTITPVDPNYFWIPKKTYIDFNLYRANSWITTMITLMPIGLIASWYCLKKNTLLFRQADTLSFAVGFVGSVAVLMYSFFTVYVDGRYIWIAYPFMIPLACMYYSEKNS